MKTDEIALWQAFQAVAQHGGFSQAARLLRTGTPQVTKRIRRLEEQLGAQLFHRSTRVVRLTPEGQLLLPKAAALIDGWLEAESVLADRAPELSGVIRITTVPFLAERILLPVVQEFSKKHPAVRFEIESSERVASLTEENFDLAIRIHNKPADSSLIYKRLAPNTMVLSASPGYMKTAPPLKKLTDLKNHRILLMDNHRQLKVGGRPLNECINENVRLKANGALLTQAGLLGLGVLVRSLWDVRDHLEKGRLVRVLENQSLEKFGDVYAVYPSRRFLPTRIIKVVEAVQQWFEEASAESIISLSLREDENDCGRWPSVAPAAETRTRVLTKFYAE